MKGQRGLVVAHNRNGRKPSGKRRNGDIPAAEKGRFTGVDRWPFEAMVTGLNCEGYRSTTKR